MSDATAIAGMGARDTARNAPPSTGWADHALVQLTLVRFREFMREPEALFWVFVFPILLAAGLGLAFRNRPPDVLNVAVVSPELAQSLRGQKLLHVQQMSERAAEEALRNGKVALLAAPGAGGKVVYGYDDTNPEGRTARMLADQAVQQAAGRTDRAHHGTLSQRNRCARVLGKERAARASTMGPDGCGTVRRWAAQDDRFHPLQRRSDARLRR